MFARRIVWWLLLASKKLESVTIIEGQCHALKCLRLGQWGKGYCCQNYPCLQTHAEFLRLPWVGTRLKVVCWMFPSGFYRHHELLNYTRIFG